MNVLRPVSALITLAALTACTAVPDFGGARTAAADPQSALTAATAGLTTGNYHFTATGLYKIEGTFHLPSESWKETTVIDSLVSYHTVIDNDQYTWSSKKKTNAAAWQHVDLSRLPERRRPSTLRDYPDRTGVTALVAAATKCTADGAAISGVVEGHRLPLVPWQTGLPAEIIGEAPFTARLDEKGLISQFILTVPGRTESPAYQGVTWSLTVDGYGASTAQRAPDRQEEASEDTYEIMGAKRIERFQPR
ncbi:hypothetical protein [Actinoplanes sp. NPDC051859]|uniref:hypothetical protein n=1 Tax=Actinoplanes sp. NPDC051859 TaxID=3363909 RepID=UPI0037B2A41A